MQKAERGDLCAKLYSQRNWHEGKVSGGGCDVHRATSFTLTVPKGGEVAAQRDGARGRRRDIPSHPPVISGRG